MTRQILDLLLVRGGVEENPGPGKSIHFNKRFKNGGQWNYTLAKDEAKAILVNQVVEACSVTPRQAGDIVDLKLADLCTRPGSAPTAHAASPAAAEEPNAAHSACIPASSCEKESHTCPAAQDREETSDEDEFFDPMGAQEEPAVAPARPVFGPNLPYPREATQGIDFLVDNSPIDTTPPPPPAYAPANPTVVVVPTRVEVPMRDKVLLDGLHPTTDQICCGLENHGIYFEVDSVSYSERYDSQDCRRLSVQKIPRAVQGYVLGTILGMGTLFSNVAPETVRLFRRRRDVIRKSKRWNPYYLCLRVWYCVWFWVLGIDMDLDKMEVKFSPHLLSETVADYRIGTAVDVVKATARMRALRIAPMPIADRDFISVLEGTELLAVGCATRLNLRRGWLLPSQCGPAQYLRTLNLREKALDGKRKYTRADIGQTTLDWKTRIAYYLMTHTVIWLCLLPVIVYAGISVGSPLVTLMASLLSPSTGMILTLLGGVLLNVFYEIFLRPIRYVLHISLHSLLGGLLLILIRLWFPHFGIGSLVLLILRRAGRNLTPLPPLAST